VLLEEVDMTSSKVVGRESGEGKMVRKNVARRLDHDATDD
jgi:hypothetical protein